MKLTTLHLNIEKSKHLDFVSSLLKDRQPDIACFAEAMHKDMEKLSSELGYELAFAPLVGIKNGEETDEEGSAIFSKKPIQEINIYRYDNNPNIEVPVYTEGQFKLENGKREEERWLYHNSLLAASISLDTKIVTITTTHFPVTDHSLPGLSDHTFPDINAVDEVERARTYLDRLIQIIRTLPTPIVFTSDLNNTRGEYVYDTVAHELLDIVPQSVVSTIDPKLHRVSGLQLAVDTIMVSPDILVKDFEIFEGVSDHKALIAVLEI
jgi:hypothetical protein